MIDGRWVRGSHGYELRVGIDTGLASCIYIRSRRLVSHVLFVGVPLLRWKRTLQAELRAYVSMFVSHCEPVPQAIAQDADRLRRLGLAA